jgi:hypothetical protein
LLITVSAVFAQAPTYKVIMSENITTGYEKDVYKKTIVLMTEARLYLQKKYKKKIVFAYTKDLATEKKDIEKVLEEKDARFYVYLKIVKKKSKKNLEKVLYNIVIFDKHSKRSKTVKTKAIIRDKKIVKIPTGDLKSSAKKIAKILKKK